MDDYARMLGARLREIRTQQGLSLHAVEERSGGRLKAVVIGSYERGDRAITVQKLADLAEFYTIPVAEILPDATQTPSGPAATSVTLNLQRLAQVPVDTAGPLARYAAAIQSRRGDYNGRVLSIRGQDLESLAILYNTSAAELTEQLITWGVLPADAQQRIGNSEH